MSEKPAEPLLAAIEAGGTKFVCAVGTGPDDIRARTSIETRTPEQTITDVTRWFVGQKAKIGTFQAMGIGSFGPVDLNPESATFGFITSTPKGGWQHVDLVGQLRSHFKVPVGFDTDVNAAALGESLWGAGIGYDPLVYITVGTGVGGGVLVNGKPLHGLLHPEIGHLQVPPPTGTGAVNLKCQCPFHENCVEGYASGMSIMKRWGVVAEHLPANHPVWEDVSDVMSHALANLVLTLSPRRIILGGGVMKQSQLFGLTRSKVVRVLNGYLQCRELGGHIDEYIVPPGLGDNSGIAGAMALGMQALAAQR
jgi:fructokinase